jgi:hypothetical protein
MSYGIKEDQNTPTGFAARAGVEAAHALTINPDHSLGADHFSLQYQRSCHYSEGLGDIRTSGHAGAWEMQA